MVSNVIHTFPQDQQWYIALQCLTLSPYLLHSPTTNQLTKTLSSPPKSLHANHELPPLRMGSHRLGPRSLYSYPKNVVSSTQTDIPATHPRLTFVAW